MMVRLIKRSIINNWKKIYNIDFINVRINLDLLFAFSTKDLMIFHFNVYYMYIVYTLVCQNISTCMHIWVHMIQRPVIEIFLVILTCNTRVETAM